MRTLIKLFNTLYILFNLILDVVTLPLAIIPALRAKFIPDIKWKYLFTHRALVCYTKPSTHPRVLENILKLGGAITWVGYGMNMVVIHHCFADNKGVLYHELGHCVVPEAAADRLGGQKVHDLTEPAPYEIAADMYAVKHGYGQELYTFLSHAAELVPESDSARRAELIKEAMQN